MSPIPFTRRLFALPLLAAIAGCSPSAPPPTAAASASPVPPGGCDARFILQNRSTTSVAEFYFRQAGSSDWGPDRFGTRLLSRGLTMGFRVVGEGRHDLRIVWATGRESRLDNVNLCETPLIVAENDRLFTPSGAPPAPASAPAPRARGAGRQ